MLAGSGCRWVRGQSFKLTGIKHRLTACPSSPMSRTHGQRRKDCLVLINHVRSPDPSPSLRYPQGGSEKAAVGPGEFATLHEAQLPFAREHGLPSWGPRSRSTSAPARPG